MSELEDLSRFVSDEPPHGMTPEQLAQWIPFINGPEITVSGTYNDAAEPGEPCDCDDCCTFVRRVDYYDWPRAHRN